MTDAPPTMRDYLDRIDKLSDPLPKTAFEAFERLCLICEEVEGALNLFNNADEAYTYPPPDRVETRHRLIPDPPLSGLGGDPHTGEA